MIRQDFILPNPAAVAGVILAGGRASRMGGGDKGRTEIGGQTILARQIAALKPQVAALALNVNGSPERFDDAGLPVLADDGRAAGPLAGLLAGLEWAAEAGFGWLLTVPCDTPYLPPDLVMRLGGDGAAIAASDGRSHPVIGLWPVTLVEPLRRFVIDEGGRRAHAWAERCGARTVEWPEHTFFNVNTEADRQRAEEILASRRRPAAAVVLPHAASAQDLLADFAAGLRAEGVRVGGLIQQGPKDEAALVALDTGERFPIMQKLGASACCAVDNQSMACAAMAVRRAVDTRLDAVIVNKFGHLEADGDGLADEMMAVMAEGIPLLTTVSITRVDAWMAFTGGMCALLPADADALRRWWGE